MASNIRYQRIPIDRFNDVIQHLRSSFFADEPLNMAVNLCRPGEGHAELEHHSLSTLEYGLSIMAVDENDKIAGVVLNGVLHSGDVAMSLENLERKMGEGFKKIFHLLYEQNMKVDLFNQFRVNKILDIRILSVDSSFRGQGIAKGLLMKCEDVAREEGFKILKTDATGMFSQKVSATLGFQVASEVKYQDYRKNGKPVFNVAKPHDGLKIMYKLVPDNTSETAF